MAKAGRRARARAAASMRAAAISRSRNALRAVQQPQAPPSGQSRLEKLPGDVLGLVVGFLGFHSLPAASNVSKTLYELPDLTAARARHRLTLEAMPNRWGGERDLCDTNSPTEYLSLAPIVSRNRFPRGQNRPNVVYHQGRALVFKEYEEESLDDFFSPHLRRCLFPTWTDQGGYGAFIVDVDKDAGVVTVYQYPIEEANGEEIAYPERKNFEWILKGPPGHFDLDGARVVERHEAVGVFVGLSRANHEIGYGTTPEYGDSVMLQLPVADHKNPQYDYIVIGESISQFTSPEPVTRYFSNIARNHAITDVALTSSLVIFPTCGCHYAHRASLRDWDRQMWYIEEDQGESVWELCAEYDIPKTEPRTTQSGYDYKVPPSLPHETRYIMKRWYLHRMGLLPESSK